MTEIEKHLRDPIRLAMLERLAPLMRDPLRARLEPEAFDEAARALFDFQFARCEPYRLLCESLGVRPKKLKSAADIPFVPTEAFRQYRLACFPSGPGQIEFHTSGTTSDSPGRHFLPTTELYDAGAMPWFAKCLIDAERPPRFLALTASPRAAPHSSLVHMIAAAGGRFACDGRAEFYVGPGGLDIEALGRAIDRARAESVPLLILTTAFSLVHWLEALESRGERLKLEGATLMETGGYKGRSRELTREHLHGWAADRLGLEPRRIINEYGMTELSSQFYDISLVDRRVGREGSAVKRAPPWARVRIVDPASRREVGIGETGLIHVIDLANVDSCAFVATADLGRRLEDGFEILGRLPGASDRGCSLEYEPMPAPSDS
jgi:hypothetical protein